MKKRNLYFLFAILFGVCSCTNTKTSSADGEIQIDPELQELGELNSLALQYDDVSEKAGDYLVVKSKDKWGVINIKGDTIIGFDYDDITYSRDGYWDIKKRRQVGKNYYDFGLAKIDGTILVSPVEDCYYCGPIAKGLYFAKKSDGYAFFNENGKEVFLTDEESGYDIPYPSEVYAFGEKSFMALLANTRWYRISVKEDGVNCEIDTVEYADVKTCGNLCYVKNDEGKWGAIDVDGKLVIPYTYSDVKKRGDGVNCVFIQNDEGKWGYIKDGKVIGAYDDFTFSYDNYSIVKDEQNYVVLDNNGNAILRVEDLYDMRRHEDVYVGLYHVYDKNGKTIFALGNVDDSLRIERYINGYVVVANYDAGTWSIYDNSGKVVVPFDNVRVEYGKESVALTKTFEENDSVISKLFNTKSAEYIEMPYHVVYSSFADGYYLAELEDEHFFINEEGKTGILNLKELLEHKKQQAYQIKYAHKDMNIKEQLMKMINEDNGREVISSPNDIKELKEQNDGKYSAKFVVYGEYFTVDYAIREIVVDKDYIVQDFKIECLLKTPTNKVKPVGGVTVEDQMMYYQHKLQQGNRYNPYK